MNDSIEVKRKRNLPIQIDRALVERDGAKIGVYGIAVYSVLCLYENMPEISPSLTTIGNTLGISRNTVKSAIEKLVECGWLEVYPRFNPVTKQNDTHVYHMVNRPEGVGQEMTEGRSGGDHDPTTISNPENVASLWNKLVGGTINPTHIELLHDYEAEFGYEWVRDAIKETAGSKTSMQLRGMTPKYLLSILTRWQREGRGTDQRSDFIPPTGKVIYG